MQFVVIAHDYKDDDALNVWLEKEAYVTGNVWEKIDVIECKVGPSFLDK